jgi:A/G-specific adenine glycosylase
MSAAKLDELQRALLEWFAEGGRDLPWRRTRDPYRVLVAEIMLQQTQVERVIPKYLAFLEAFATLEDLAAAPTAEVIRLWAGLGYNRRAVNLQRAARAVRDEHGGAFPHEVEVLRRLPGVGPYTAGAVACFAFEQDVAFMDTNIRRVLRRACVGPDGAVPEPSDRGLLALGADMVPAGHGWAWNQAIMELGALVCTAAAPACRRCPIRASCRAYAALAAEDAAIVLAMGNVGEPGSPTPLLPGSGSPTPLLPGSGSHAPLPSGGEGPGSPTPLLPGPGSHAPLPSGGEGPGSPTPLLPSGGVRRVAERRDEAFVGSRRWYRGRIVDALRPLSNGASMDLDKLGPLIRPGFSPEDLPWLRELAAGLARDGLVTIEGDAVRLP